MKIGIFGNNPGRIPSSVSPLMGEVKRDNSFSKDHYFFRKDAYSFRYNIRYKEFDEMSWGYRAMFLILHNISELYNMNTLKSLIQRWCQGSEIKRYQYTIFIAKQLGTSINAYIDTTNHDTMVRMVRLMVIFESGVKAIPSEVEEGWLLFSSRF